MPAITFVDVDGEARTVEAEIGATVMETAIRNDVPGILASCGGSCACATCHVYVEDDWWPSLSERSDEEEDMLDTAHDVRPTSRLSCQIRVSEDLDGLRVQTPEKQY